MSWDVVRLLQQLKWDDIRNQVHFTKHKGNLQPQCSPQIMGPSSHQGGWLPHTKWQCCSISHLPVTPIGSRTASSTKQHVAALKDEDWHLQNGTNFACFNIQQVGWILCHPVPWPPWPPLGLELQDRGWSRMIKDQSYSEWDQFHPISIPQKLRCYMLLPLPQQAWQSPRSDSEAHSSITMCNRHGWLKHGQIISAAATWSFSIAFASADLSSKRPALAQINPCSWGGV